MSFAFSAHSLERKNVIIFVADGLRGSSVNARDTPSFERIRTQGVRFDNSHSVFPTVTTVNASVLATGHALGDTGNFSNHVFVGYPLFDGRRLEESATLVPSVKNNAVLKDLNAHYGGNYLGEVSLLAWAREHGFSTAAIGKLGPTVIQDIRLANLVSAGSASAVATIVVDDATGLPHGVPVSDSIVEAMRRAGLPISVPRNPKGTQAISQRYFTNVFLKVILPEFERAKKPFIAVYWCADPDATQHNQVDSLNQFVPGINGPSSLAGIKNADANLGKILSYVDAHAELAKSTNIIVVSDHGFSTISKKWLNADRTLATSSYAAGFTYRNQKGEVVTQDGSLPLGFLAIDLAHALRMRLFDPDGVPDQQNGVPVYPEVDPRGRAGLRQYPSRGNGLIGSRAVVAKDSGADIAIASSGGCVLIYLVKHNPKLASRMVSFFLTQDYVGGIFVNKKQCGELPGTLGLDSIHLEGTAKLPTPAIVVPFLNFALDAAHPLQSQVSIADTSGQEGMGTHGSMGRGDTFNFMAAMGPNFKTQYTDLAPVSNVDIPITCARILGLDLPSVGKLRGRVIEEALVGGPEAMTVTSGTLESQPTSSGLTMRLIYQDVGKHRYFDAGGFPGRSVGVRK